MPGRVSFDSCINMAAILEGNVWGYIGVCMYKDIRCNGSIALAAS